MLTDISHGITVGGSREIPRPCSILKLQILLYKRVKREKDQTETEQQAHIQICQQMSDECRNALSVILTQWFFQCAKTISLQIPGHYGLPQWR